MRNILVLIAGLVAAVPLLSGCAFLGVGDSGLKGDGSYYTRLEWSDYPGGNPRSWVANIVDGGERGREKAWSAPSATSANAVIGFFGRERRVGAIAITRNLGPESSAANFAKHANVYFSSDEKAGDIGDQGAKINRVEWNKVLDINLENTAGVQEYKFPRKVRAKYIRIELEGNYSGDEKKPGIDMGEIKLLP